MAVLNNGSLVHVRDTLNVLILVKSKPNGEKPMASWPSAKKKNRGLPPVSGIYSGLSSR
jgi:hypothetical protein